MFHMFENEGGEGITLLNPSTGLKYRNNFSVKFNKWYQKKL